MTETKTEKTMNYVAMIVNVLAMVVGMIMSALHPDNAWATMGMASLVSFSNTLAAMGYTKGRSIVKAQQLQGIVDPK